MSGAVDPRVSQRMARIRGRDTTPEMAVRRALHARGLRYRVHMRPVPNLRRTGDIVFTKANVVILIDGCFWHGCPLHYRPAKGVRADFWAAKISRNQRRDDESTAAFRDAGWQVLRFWEHESPATIALEIAATLSPN